jgi:hypothetical protein
MHPKNNLLRQPVLLLITSVTLLPTNVSQAQQPNKDPNSPSQTAPEKKTFFARWAEFYRQDWMGTAVSSPAPARRGAPSPLDSPPFPNSDWSYGGSPVIGEPDTNSYPLMTAINQARSRTKLYGWIDPTLNFSTSARSNAPEANDVYSNRFELNQLVLYAERLPDSVQRDHIDWGYHLTALYGTDYRFTTAKGYGVGQLVNDQREYGFDPTLEYIDVYFPQVAQGMNLRLGRFISVPGIEAQLAPNNYIFSHSLLYAIDPFTDTGLIATVKLNDRWLLQLGITGGHDVALWAPDAKPSGTACVSYTTKSVNDNLYACANGLNDGKYAYVRLGYQSEPRPSGVKSSRFHSGQIMSTWSLVLSRLRRDQEKLRNGKSGESFHCGEQRHSATAAGLHPNFRRSSRGCNCCQRKRADAGGSIPARARKCGVSPAETLPRPPDSCVEWHALPWH